MGRPRKYKVIDGRYCCPDCDKTYKSEYSCCNHWSKAHKPYINSNQDPTQHIKITGIQVLLTFDIQH